MRGGQRWASREEDNAMMDRPISHHSHSLTHTLHTHTYTYTVMLHIHSHRCCSNRPLLVIVSCCILAFGGISLCMAAMLQYNGRNGGWVTCTWSYPYIDRVYPARPAIIRQVESGAVEFGLSRFSVHFSSVDEVMRRPNFHRRMNLLLRTHW